MPLLSALTAYGTSLGVCIASRCSCYMYRLSCSSSLAVPCSAGPTAFSKVPARDAHDAGDDNQSRAGLHEGNGRRTVDKSIVRTEFGRIDQVPIAFSSGQVRLRSPLDRGEPVWREQRARRSERSGRVSWLSVAREASREVGNGEKREEGERQEEAVEQAACGKHSRNNQSSQLSALLQLGELVAPADPLAANEDVRHCSLTGLLQEVRLYRRALITHQVKLVDLGLCLLVRDGSNELLCSLAVWLLQVRGCVQRYSALWPRP